MLGEYSFDYIISINMEHYIRDLFLTVAPYTAATNKIGNEDEIAHFCYTNCHSICVVFTSLFGLTVCGPCKWPSAT
jgi:hypothetical protein